MSLFLRITRQAISDIDANKSWWERHRSVGQADEWEDAVLEQIGTLTMHAFTCPPSREDGRTGIAYPLKDKRLGLKNAYTHRAVFTIKDETVYVLAVRSCRQRDLQAADLPSNVDSIP